MVIFALALTAMMGMLALSLDLGFGLMERRAVQNFADTTAMAGTLMEANNAPPVVQHTDQDVYRIMSDTISPSSISSSKLTITNAAGVGTTQGQVYLVGVYTDVSGTPLTGPVYVTNTNSNLNTNAQGIQSTATLTYGTFFARAIGVSTVKVSASATAIGQHVSIAGTPALNPYAARWDPPWGPNPTADGTTNRGAQDYDTTHNAGTGCSTPTGSFQCAVNGGGHPVIGVQGDGIGVMDYSLSNPTMTFKLWDNGNGWLNENTGPLATDPDWAANSSSFKGIFNTKTNNCRFGNQGSGEGSHPAPILNADGVGLFPIVDTSTGSGSNISISIYDIIAIHITQNNNQGLRGNMVPKVGINTVDPTCGGTTFTTTGQFIMPRLIS